MRLIRAVAAVSVVNLLGPSEIGENPEPSSSARSPSENPPGGPTASWIAAFKFWMRPGGRGFPPGSARKRRHPAGTPPPSQVPPRAASNEGEDPNLGRRLRRDCLSAAFATRASRTSRCGLIVPPGPLRSHTTKSIAVTPSGTACSMTCSTARRSGIPTRISIGRESSPAPSRRSTIRPTAAWRLTDSSTHS